ncbi:MAG: tetratricopeptide repeat protein [Williamsia sp.]|nr:tetratricopeptide repeat protein [Williamsia sp.]
MIRSLLVFSFLYVFLHAPAQTHKIDSVNRLIEKASTDTAKINRMIAKLDLLTDVNLDSAAALGNQVIRESVSLKYRQGEAKARMLTATVHCYAGAYELARQQLNAAEVIFRSLNDALNLGRVYNGGYGVMYGMQGQYDSAKLYFEKSIPLFEGTGDEMMVANAYQNIAISYQQTSNLKMALSYLQQALRIMEKNNDASGQATILINMGNTLENIGDTLRSEESFLKAIDLSKNAGLKREEMYAYSNLSTLYLETKNIYPAYDAASIAAKLAQKMGDKGMQSANLSKAASALAGQNKYHLAEQVARQGVSIADASNQPFNINQAYGTLGTVLSQQGRYGYAIPYLEKAIDVIKNSDLYSVAFAENYKALALCYEQTGRYEKALQAYKRSDAIYDSARNKENVRKTTELSLNYEFDKKQQVARLERQQQEAAAKCRQQALTAGLLCTLLLAGIALFAYRNKQKANRIIHEEKKRSDDLLLNILPHEVADELKNKGYSEAKGFEQATVLFADIKEFTKMGEQLSPKELVFELDYYFRLFDTIIEEFTVEKIKTIGDAYLCAGGLPVSTATHALDVVRAAVNMQQQLLKIRQEKMAADQIFFEFRIGIHTGPVVAGIVGIKKFAYDIWGDTVNTAARMEQCSEPGKINISGETYNHVREQFACTYRGKIPVKHKLDMDMYFVDEEITS